MFCNLMEMLENTSALAQYLMKTQVVRPPDLQNHCSPSQCSAGSRHWRQYWTLVDHGPEQPGSSCADVCKMSIGQILIVQSTQLNQS